MNIKEIQSKTILSSSKVYNYVINPYVGCQHGCQYCYARFIKKFSGHKEPWGEFVDIKVNRMNYHYADWIYRKYRLEDKLSDDFFQRTGHELAYACKKSGITCN